MTTKAEELVYAFNLRYRDGGSPPNSELVSLLEQYGRLVREAAAKQAEAGISLRRSHFPVATPAENYLDLIAKTIRDMPLP